MNLRARARKLFSRDQLSEHTVCATKVDHAVLHDLRKRATKIDDAITTTPHLPGGDVLDGRIWERLAEDLWSEFYGDAEPSLRARDKIDKRFRVNRELADKTARDDGFRSTRSRTRGEVMQSGIGLLGALESLRKSYGNELAEHAEAQNEIADAEDQLDSIDDMLAELRQRRAQAADGEQAAIDERVRDLAKRKRAAVSQVEEAVARGAHSAGDLIDAAKMAIAKATDEAQDAVELSSLLPGKEAGPRSHVAPDQMIEFASRVHGDPVLKAVLEMMGRLDLSMGTVRRQQRKGGYEEIVDIEMGDDLQVILPQEKVLLMHPLGRLDFFRRYHERSLMQYEMWSEQELKRGPVIFGADGSASMKGPANVFCRGLTLASCSIGNREHRNTAAIEFGSKGELREFFFPGDRPLDTETALDFAQHFFRGGTDINQVLVRAKELIDNEAPFHSADLVIVTDGGDRLTEQTFLLRDALREMGVKIHGICVGVHPTQYMVEVCDGVSSLFDFAGPNATSDRIAIDLS